MSHRIDLRRAPARAEASAESAPETSSPPKTQRKSAAHGVDHTAGSRKLAAAREQGPRLPPTISIEVGTRDLTAPPAPSGSIPWVRVIAKAPEPAKKPAPPPAPKPAAQAIPAPMRFHMAARAKYDALVADYEKTRAELDRAATTWDAVARQRRSTQAPGALRTLADSAWHAERQADLARALRRELTIEFGAAKHEYEVVLGLARGAAIGPPRPVDTSRDPEAPRPVQSELERFQARLDRYNHSVNGIKSSGVLAPPVAVAYVAAAELHDRKLDRSDYDKLDGIYQSGAIANVPLGIATGVRSTTPGAAPPAPGVDHRAAPGRHAAAQSFEQRQPAIRDR
jgi:hypothetical protein